YTGEWREAVLQSLTVLKALTYSPTGGIVAAATTSLPEKIGGVRNWDYRHCWLRDATLTLLAFLNAGYLDEAAAWRVWLLRAGAAPALHALEGHGLGRLRPRRAGGRAVRPQRPCRPVAEGPRRDSRGGLPPRLRPRAELVRAVLRLEAPRREPADHPARRLPP